MIHLLGVLTAGAVFLLFVFCPLARRGRGRHVSRPAGRRARLDAAAVSVVQILWLVLAAGYALVDGVGVVPVVLQMILTGWLLDDLLTGGRDHDDRKRRRAKAKLRMPKPVKLRPAERWTPSPA